MKSPLNWPKLLYIVRHGQSSGNVARDLAEAEGHASIAIEWRDVDVPLSDLGERQAESVGHWFKDLPPDRRPTIILSSPYVRARQTADAIHAAMQESASPVCLVVDERLREREFGMIDRLTKKGVIEKYPDQAELYSRIRKFYYRPPGGESWCDVILRLRSILDTLSREYAGERVLLVCHSVVVLCFRYLFEQMTEEQILTIDRENEIANCSVTSYRGTRSGTTPSSMTLDLFNFVAPLREEGTEVTRASDRSKDSTGEP